MKQHEVEALRGLMASWGKRNNPNFDICVKELEALLISIPASDDGLRELIENLKQHAAKKEKLRDGILWAIGYIEEFFELERLALEEKKQDDDGLREGLEEIIFNWAKDADIGTIEARLIENHIDEIEKLLATNPDGWKPIAGAPRDGREIMLYCPDLAYKLLFCKWEKTNKIWIDDSTGKFIPEDWATHFKPLPAPPREGKG